MVPHTTFSSNSIKRSFISPSKARTFPLSWKRYTSFLILTHQNVVQLRILCHQTKGSPISDITMGVSINPVIRTGEFDRWVMTLRSSLYRMVFIYWSVSPQKRIDRVSRRNALMCIIPLRYSSCEMSAESRRQPRCWRHEQEGNAIFHF